MPELSQLCTAQSPRAFHGPHRHLEGVRALPTLPAILFRFLGLVADARVQDQQLADFIWTDPSLLARAMAAVNAAPACRHLPVGKLRAAIAALGRQRLRNLAYTTPLLPLYEPTRTGFHSETFWERSLLCASACEAMATQLELPVPAQYYIGGLMHEIGYLAVLRERPADLRRVIERRTAQPDDVLEIEREVFGMDHCELGLEIAAQLQFEPWLCAAIGKHHSASPDSDWVTRITCIGGAFCSYKGIDFFPSHVLSRRARERELEEIIRGLLPDLPAGSPAELLAMMEDKTDPIRNRISGMLADLQPAEKSASPATHCTERLPVPSAAAACV